MSSLLLAQRRGPIKGLARLLMPVSQRGASSVFKSAAVRAPPDPTCLRPPFTPLSALCNDVSYCGHPFEALVIGREIFSLVRFGWGGFHDYRCRSHTFFLPVLISFTPRGARQPPDGGDSVSLQILNPPDGGCSAHRRVMNQSLTNSAAAGESGHS